jgi:hypothetical protein
MSTAEAGIMFIFILFFLIGLYFYFDQNPIQFSKMFSIQDIFFINLSNRFLIDFLLWRDFELRHWKHTDMKVPENSDLFKRMK